MLFLQLWDMILEMFDEMGRNAAQGGFSWLTIAFQILLLVAITAGVGFLVAFSARRGWDMGRK